MEYLLLNLPSPSDRVVENYDLSLLQEYEEYAGCGVTPQEDFCYFEEGYPPDQDLYFNK